MPIKMKRGPLSDDEKTYCIRYREKKTPEQIGAHLRRAPSTIQKFFESERLDALQPRPESPFTVGHGLENRPEWATFQRQFTEDELEFFKYQYIQLMNQFGRDDVMPTEEMQIFDVITMSILISRTLSEQKLIAERMSDITRQLKIRKNAPELESEFADCRKANATCGARHDAYVMRRSALLKDMKSTREQRIRVVEGSRQSFVGLIKRLMADDEFRVQAGYEAGSMAVAARKERERLAAPHKFGDGAWDQPILTPDTVLDDYGVEAEEGVVIEEEPLDEA